MNDVKRMFEELKNNNGFKTIVPHLSHIMTFVTYNDFLIDETLIHSNKILSLRFVNQVAIKFCSYKYVLKPNIIFGNKFKVSVIIFRKCFFEAYYTNSFAGEVWSLNVYFARFSKSETIQM